MRIPPLLFACVVASGLALAGPAQAQPLLQVTILDTPTVALGYTSAAIRITLRNIGDQDLVVSAVNIQPVGRFADFSLNNNGHVLPLTLVPNQFADFLARFTPTAVGYGDTQVEVDSNDPLQPVSPWPLGGWGTDVPLSSMPTALNFGDVAVGNFNSSSLRWTNATDHDVQLQRFAFALGAATPFAVGGGGPPILLRAFTTDTFVEVDVAPRVGGPVSDTMTITTDDGSVPTLSVPLSVTGLVPSMDVQPRALDLGYAAPGTSSATKTVTITNTSQAELHIAGVSLGGPGAQSFVPSIGLDSAFTVYPFSTQAIDVLYHPTTRAPHNATLVITPSYPGLPPVSVQLSGTADLIDALPAEVAFLPADNAVVGTTSPHKQTVTLHVPVGSNVPVRISDIAVSRDFRVDWSKTTHNLISGGTTTFDVYFTPKVAGPLGGAVVIRTSDLGVVLTIPLSGVGLPAPEQGCGCALGGRPPASRWLVGSLALVALGLGWRRGRRQATPATASS